MGIRASGAAIAVALITVAACGGDDGLPPPGPPTTVAKLSSTALSGTVGTTLDSLRVRVTDADGTGVPGVAVDFQVASGGGLIAVPPPDTGAAALRSAAAAASFTNANGEAGASWTLGTQAGPQTATAAVSGLTPVEFAAIADPDIPSQWGFTEASGFIGIAGQNVDQPIVIRVTDRFNNGVQGISVAWTAVDAGASVAAATSTTDSVGDASVDAALGAAHGLYLFVAAPSGFEADTIAILAVKGFSDAAGDTAGSGGAGLIAHDITFFGGTIVDSVLFMYMRFQDNVVGMPTTGGSPSNAVVGSIDLDTDQDSTTGFTITRVCALQGGTPLPLGFGVDGIFDVDPGSSLVGVLQNPPPGTITVLQADSVDQVDRCSGTVFVIGIVPIYENNTLTVFSPIAFLDDDAAFDFTSFVANGVSRNITDLAPDSLGASFDLGPVPATAALRTGRADFLRLLPRTLARTAPVRVSWDVLREMRSLRQ